MNRYGESDPLEAQKSVVAKDAYDKADRPGTPDIVDWDKNWADLKWTPPADVKMAFKRKRFEPGSPVTS